MKLIDKIQDKTMRLMARFQFSRKIAIGFLKKNSTIERVHDSNFNINTTNFVSELREKGFSSTFKIPTNVLNEIIEYSKSVNYTGLTSQKNFSIDYNNPKKKGSDLWYLDKNIYKNCKAVYNLAHNEDLVNIAKAYIGSEPKIHQVHSWWSFPKEDDNYVHNYGYHYDIDALRFVKFFIYLTDVDIDAGPHVIIANTHKRKTWFQKFNRRITEEDVKKRFRKDDVTVMLGKAGEGFFEDTFSYHKGTAPKKPRFILQVEYSI